MIQDPTLLACLCFGFGVVLQSIISVKGRFSYLYLIIVIIISAFTAIIMSFKYDFGLYGMIILTFTLYALLFGLYYKKQILPFVSEGSILTLTIIFWYIFFLYLRPNHILGNIILYLAMIPTIGTFYLAFSQRELSFKGKLFFYIWFLIITVTIIFSYFPYGDFFLFFSDKSSSTINPIFAFLTGMVLFYLINYTTYLLALLPIPDKHQTFKKRMKEVKEHARILSNKYSNQQISSFVSFAIIILLIGTLVLNHVFQLINDYLLINLWILFVFISLSIKLPSVKHLNLKNSE